MPFNYELASQALGLDPDWYESADQMKDDIDGRVKDNQTNVAKEMIQQRARTRLNAPTNRPGAARPMIPGFGPAQQYMQSQSMANNTMQAIGDENDSRVAQLREMRRMAHEQEMERMRQDALLQRLQMEGFQKERDRELQMKTLAAQGILKKVRRNDGRGSGMYTTYE